ncbi:hypothetical protein IFM89_007048 [Coptis chinensis]|uniref:Proteasome assembly chaperone 1 n=1 Tax=Coptis chinensis TaxID=261450 RepID=A0A835HJB5_9MAGN|nr:hypothetical protein IFM89_007048 [Coptis chinensis]
MEDPLTEDPPPSRFFDEDLNNFTPPSPLLPPPSLHFTTPTPLSPSLLIIAISTPSIHVINSLTQKSLLATLTLPDTKKNSPSSVYTIPNNPNTVLITIQSSTIPSEMSRAVAKFILDEINPEKALILGSVQSRNYRGKLAPDEEMMFKLETLEEKKSGGDLMVKGVDYFPSGSLIDGLGAAVLGQCQVRKIRGSLFVTWPDSSRGIVLKVKGLIEGLLGELEFGDEGGVRIIRDSRDYYELYA